MVKSATSRSPAGRASYWATEAGTVQVHSCQIHVHLKLATEAGTVQVHLCQIHVHLKLIKFQLITQKEILEDWYHILDENIWAQLFKANDIVS